MNQLEPVGSAPLVKRRPVRLRTARDARKFLAKLVNELYRREISSDQAAKMGFLLGIFLKSIEVDELETRLRALEDFKERSLSDAAETD